MNDLSPQPDLPGAADATVRPSLFTVLPYIMLPMALAASDQTIMATALPAVARELGGVERISWVVVANIVSGVAAAPVYGQLRDVLGSRRMMLTALSIYVCAAICCGLAPTFGLLVAGRFMQGIGGGGLMTLSQAIIGETIPPLERARYQGYLASVVVTASVAGPMLGGVLTTNFGWRSIYALTIPLTLVALAVTIRSPVRRPAPRELSFDYPGLVLFFCFIAPLLLGLDRLRTFSAETVPLAILLLTIAAISLMTLIWQERRAFSPVIPVGLITQRTIWMSDGLAMCHGAALVSLSTMLPIYLHVVKGASASETGLALLPLMLGIGSGSMITGRMVSRTRRTAIFPSIGLSVAFVLLLHQALAIDGWSRRELGFWLLLAGMSMGTVMSVVQVTVQTFAGRERIGQAAASVQISRAVGAASGATISGAVLFGALHLADPNAHFLFVDLIKASGDAGTPPAQVPDSIRHAFSAAFVTISLYSAMGAAIAWRIPKRHI